MDQAPPQSDGRTDPGLGTVRETIPKPQPSTGPAVRPPPYTPPIREQNRALAQGGSATPPSPSVCPAETVGPSAQDEGVPSPAPAVYPMGNLGMSGLLERFQCLRPPTFVGSYGPKEAEYWLDRISKMLRMLHCTEPEQDEDRLSRSHGPMIPRPRPDMPIRPFLGKRSRTDSPPRIAVPPGPMRRPGVTCTYCGKPGHAVESYFTRMRDSGFSPPQRIDRPRPQALSTPPLRTAPGHPSFRLPAPQFRPPQRPMVPQPNQAH
ncbi:uncharacterized protein LOC131247357 [Magnolia sinica]|uniref:uncharacterized protein LOC131247357 n=1 Tax=Magnolia sinica TaxID=86752 RepID=UPI002658F88A|nr:uncharacterized protein LOC131247357 [Magnolia sinica]